MKSSHRRTKQKAGAVVYRLRRGAEPEVLLISSRKHEGSWVFPMGTVERGETPEGAAARECEEEAGCRVQIDGRLPSAHRRGKKRDTHFTFFLAQVLRQVTPLETDRSEQWVGISRLVNAVPSLFGEVAAAASIQLNRVAGSGDD